MFFLSQSEQKVEGPSSRLWFLNQKDQWRQINWKSITIAQYQSGNKKTAIKMSQIKIITSKIKLIMDDKVWWTYLKAKTLNDSI